MQYKKILVTGGAGFVGSTICLQLKKKYPHAKIVAFDNLMRRGSELNLTRFKKKGVEFLHGDVRNKDDLQIANVDLIIECSAEPSVMAGVNSSPEYLLQTNLIGAINCFELARKTTADVIFLSTSRVYPIKAINSLHFSEESRRFTLLSNQTKKGASKKGISEEFSLEGVRSLYGATKLSAEFLLNEYIANYKIRGVINRFGLISGPWQMGKVDQGIIVYWMANHIYKKPLSYIGFGGSGKQVRDVIHALDVFDIIDLQIQNISKFSGEVYNIGGGIENSISLVELTDICNEITGNTLKIKRISQTRQGDVKVYISDITKIQKILHWKPKRSIQKTLEEVYEWIMGDKKKLENILL